MPTFAADSTNNSVYLVLQNEVTGLPETGVAYNDTGATASYVRPGANATTITLATLALPNSAHADGGFIEVSSSLATGLYRLDVPDAAFAAGVTFAIININFDGVVAVSLEVGIEPPVSVEAIVNAAANKIADHTIRRTQANVRASSDGDTITERSLLGAVEKLTNRIARSGSDLVIYQNNDTTESFRQVMTADASANPIIELDTV